MIKEDTGGTVPKVLGHKEVLVMATLSLVALGASNVYDNYFLNGTTGKQKAQWKQERKGFRK